LASHDTGEMPYRGNSLSAARHVEWEAIILCLSRGPLRLSVQNELSSAVRRPNTYSADPGCDALLLRRPSARSLCASPLPSLSSPRQSRDTDWASRFSRAPDSGALPPTVHCQSPETFPFSA